MKISERLAQLRAQRGEQVVAMETLLAKSMDENRSFDDAEQTGFDERKSAIAGIDKQIDNFEEMERTMAKSASAPAANPGSAVDLPAGSRFQVTRNLPKGAAFTRYAMSLAAAKGNTMAAVEIAKANWSKDTPEVEAVLRAAVAAGTTTDTNWAAPLATYTNMANEFIELLRPDTILGQMTGFRNVPFMIRMPRQLSGSTANWVGEGAAKPISALSFDSLTVPMTKLASIVVITEELARASTPSAQAAVQQDMRDTITQFMDQQFVDPTVAPVSGVSPGSITYGAPTIDSTGSTVALVTNDLNTALTYQAVNNISRRNKYWVLHPRTANFLMTLRTSQDIFAFRDEMNQGKLLGVPFIVSGNVPLFDQSSPVDGSNETYIVLVEASEILVADDGQILLDVSREASVQMSSTPSNSASSMVSLWQSNMVGLRAERYIYWTPRRAAAVYIIKRVAY